MTVKNVKKILTVIAILIILISLLVKHTVTVQALIFALTIKIIPNFFLPHTTTSNDQKNNSH